MPQHHVSTIKIVLINKLIPQRGHNLVQLILQQQFTKVLAIPSPGSKANRTAPSACASGAATPRQEPQVHTQGQLARAPRSSLCSTSAVRNL